MFLRFTLTIINIFVESYAKNKKMSFWGVECFNLERQKLEPRLIRKSNSLSHQFLTFCVTPIMVMDFKVLVFISQNIDQYHQRPIRAYSRH